MTTDTYMTHPNYPALDSVTTYQYNECIRYYLDQEVNAVIHSLTDIEKDQFFTMITDYPELLTKLFFVKGAPFTNYIIYGNEFYEALKEHHDGIDYTPSWIVAEYKEWLTKNNRPFPEDQAVKDNLDFTPLINFQAQASQPK